MDSSPMEDELEVSLVPVFAIETEWPRVEKMLEVATSMSAGRYDIGHLKEKLLTGEFQLWVIFDKRFEIVAAITSTFTVYPKCKFLSGQFLGGDRLADWKDKFCRIFHNWGRDNGCKAVELTGRAGWSKVLEPNGYREIYRTYQKDL